MGGNENVYLRELKVEGVDKIGGGTDGCMYEKAEGAGEDGFDEGRKIRVCVELKAETKCGNVMI